MTAFIALLISLPIVLADFECLCNYNVEQPVYAHVPASSTPIGYLYEFDCKPLAGKTLVPNADFIAVQFEKQTGYVVVDTNIHQETCPGNPSQTDLVPTTVQTTTTTMTTPKPIITTATTQTTTTYPTTTTVPMTTLPTTTTTQTTTTYPTTTTVPMTTLPTTTTTTTQTTTTTPIRTTPTTTTTTRTSSTTTTTSIHQSTVLQGNTSVCPEYVRLDTGRQHGLLGQYGNFCYELVPHKTSWSNAKHHCHLRKGNLMYISNVEEQNYITRFLSIHHYLEKVWIGLNDRSSEGEYKWISGAPLTYTNFGNDYNMNLHDPYDCFVMQQGGAWLDVKCNGGLFESVDQYVYICQYDINSGLGSIVDLIHHISVG